MTPAQQLIKALRAEGWTVQRIADAIGLKVRVVYSYISGERNPSGAAMKTLERLTSELTSH